MRIHEKAQPFPNLELSRQASALASVVPGSCDPDTVEAKSLDCENFSLSGSRPCDAFVALRFATLCVSGMDKGLHLV